jgi:hypothetical protein
MAVNQMPEIVLTTYPDGCIILARLLRAALSSRVASPLNGNIAGSTAAYRWIHGREPKYDQDEKEKKEE